MRLHHFQPVALCNWAEDYAFGPSRVKCICGKTFRFSDSRKKCSGSRAWEAAIGLSSADAGRLGLLNSRLPAAGLDGLEPAAVPGVHNHFAFRSGGCFVEGHLHAVQECGWFFCGVNLGNGDC